MKNSLVLWSLSAQVSHLRGFITLPKKVDLICTEDYIRILSLAKTGGNIFVCLFVTYCIVLPVTFPAFAAVRTWKGY